MACQPAFTSSSTNTPITLNCTTSLVVGLSEIAQTPRVTQRNLGLINTSVNLINTRNKKIKLYIHPASLFCSTTPETKWKTHVPSIKGQQVWLIIRQIPIKAGWQYASIMLRDYNRSNKHCIHLSTTKTIYFSCFIFAVPAF